jgi:F420-non-reducing hydrogenase small subunit
MSVEMQNGKLKLGLYWAAACGGCDIAIVELREKLLDLAAAADILFWPCATDSKYADVEAMPDGHLDLCLFNGSIRNTENEHLAHLLRRKSKVLVAFGSCAHEGCIPGLANLHDVRALLASAYLDAPSVDNPRSIIPQATTRVPEGEVTLPRLQGAVRTLAQVVPVDYTVPGCPPQAPQVWAALEALTGGSPPPKGSVLGVTDKTVCDECRHKREERRLKQFYRPHEIIPDSARCLFDQGIVCAGCIRTDDRHARAVVLEGKGVADVDGVAIGVAVAVLVVDGDATVQGDEVSCQRLCRAAGFDRVARIVMLDGANLVERDRARVAD